ncbi:helix-turn-helix domain-containing protein [Microbacterium halotolerans]|uniref:helix-turn-helix domain-containing protein n=1 Tax=Microbacterium halotolerans TaxID=246613 RepID=UPI000E6A97A7|nr:helix-turn-helix transcriptional regulator [Microbacterium halotolerans]
MARITSPAAVRIGENIRAARIRRGLSQDQLAVATSINSSNIRSYETGRSLLAVPSLVRIADALEVDPGELLAEVTSEMLAPRARKAPDAR